METYEKVLSVSGIISGGCQPVSGYDTVSHEWKHFMRPLCPLHATL